MQQNHNTGTSSSKNAWSGNNVRDVFLRQFFRGNIDIKFVIKLFTTIPNNKIISDKNSLTTTI